MIHYRKPVHHIFIEGPEGFGKSTLFKELKVDFPEASFTKHPTPDFRTKLLEIEELDTEAQVKFWLEDFYEAYIQLEKEYFKEEEKDTIPIRLYDRSFCSTIVYQIWQLHKARTNTWSVELLDSFEKAILDIYGRGDDQMSVIILNTDVESLRDKEVMNQFTEPLLSRDTEVKDTVDLLIKPELEKVILNLSRGYHQVQERFPGVCHFWNYFNCVMFEIDVLDEQKKRKNEDEVYSEVFNLIHSII